MEDKEGAVAELPDLFAREEFGFDIAEGDAVFAIYVKRSLTPKVVLVFHASFDDLKPTSKLLVYTGTEAYPLGNDVQAISLEVLCRELAGHS